MRSIVIGIVGIFLSFNAYSEGFKTSGCLDCFNFVAPSISGAETLASPQIGLIVFDTNVNKFRGFGPTGIWQNIGKDDSIVTKSSSYTALASDSVILASATLTVTLPSAASYQGKTYKIRNTSSSGIVTVSSAGTDVIDGYASITLASGLDEVEVTSDGSSTWHIINSRIAPTTTVLSTVGSSTYTVPAGVKYLSIRMVGGGGGGGGSGSSPGVGGSGQTTTFGTSFLTCNGGAGGSGTNGSPGGAGGTASIAAGASTLVSLKGATGSPVGGSINNTDGGTGGVSPFGSAGAGGVVNAVGGAAQNNSGSGGGGAGGASALVGAGGGGAGGYVDVIIGHPGTSYSYTVGAGGSGGIAGGGGFAGGAGGSGVIIVVEHYQ